MHLITLIRDAKAKVINWNDPKQVMLKSQDLSRSLEIKPIWTFDTEFPTFFSIIHAHILVLLSSLQLNTDI